MAAIGGILFPKLAQAGVLDQLSNTIDQTVQQVTNAATDPVRQVDKVVGSVEQTVDRVIGSVTSPIDNLLGGINHTIQNFLSPFQQQLQQYLLVFDHTFEKILGDVFGGIFGGKPSDQPWNEQWGSGGGQTPSGSAGLPDWIKNGSSGSSNGGELPDWIKRGALGLPDVPQNHKTVFDQILRTSTAGAPATPMQKTDRFNANPVPLAQSLQFLQDRTQNTAMAATVLSAEGQTAMQQEMKAASATLTQIQGLAQQAQGMDVTQDVMKNLTAVQANQSALQAGSYAQLMAIRAQDATNATVTSNISEALDEANRARHAQAMASADRILRASAGFYIPGAVK